MFYSLERSYAGNEVILNEEIEYQDEKKFNRLTKLLLVISVFYVTFGTFVMALVITQSFLNDLNKTINNFTEN